MYWTIFVHTLSFSLFSVSSLPILPTRNAIHTRRAMVTVLCLMNYMFILIQFDDMAVPVLMCLCIRYHASVNGIFKCTKNLYCMQDFMIDNCAIWHWNAIHVHNVSGFQNTFCWRTVDSKILLRAYSHKLLSFGRCCLSQSFSLSHSCYLRSSQSTLC